MQGAGRWGREGEGRGRENDSGAAADFPRLLAAAETEMDNSVNLPVSINQSIKF